MKRIIAREFLILLGFVIIFLISMSLPKIPTFGVYFAVLGYPIYLVGRIALWAIKTIFGDN